MIREIQSIFQFSQCKYFPLSKRITIPEYNVVSESKTKFFSVDVKNNLNIVMCVQITGMCTSRTQNRKLPYILDYLYNKYIQEHNFSVS